MIKRRLIEETTNQIGYLYLPRLNSGLDTSSMMNIKKATDIEMLVIKGCFVADLKTFTNIHIYQEIKDQTHESTEINAATVKGFGDLSEICARIAASRGVYTGLLERGKAPRPIS
jgi:hypothetical protein